MITNFILFSSWPYLYCYCLSLGIRGEINVIVKVELFNDLNRFRQSSCGVKFFCSKFGWIFDSKCVMRHNFQIYVRESSSLDGIVIKFFVIMILPTKKGVIP